MFLTRFHCGPADGVTLRMSAHPQHGDRFVFLLSNLTGGKQDGLYIYDDTTGRWCFKRLILAAAEASR